MSARILVLLTLSVSALSAWGCAVQPLEPGEDLTDNGSMALTTQTTQPATQSGSGVDNVLPGAQQMGGETPGKPEPDPWRNKETEATNPLDPTGQSATREAPKTNR